MNIDDALDGIFETERIERARAEAHEAYEERIVKKILLVANLGDRVNELKRLVFEKTGQWKLKMSWLYEEYPTLLPVWLQPRRVGYVAHISVANLFSNFNKTPVYEAWSDIKDENPYPDKAAGLIFDWVKVKGTTMVLHDSTNEKIDNTRVNLVVGTGRNTRFLLLEQFEPFLRRHLGLPCSAEQE